MLGGVVLRDDQLGVGHEGLRRTEDHLPGDMVAQDLTVNGVSSHFAIRRNKERVREQRSFSLSQSHRFLVLLGLLLGRNAGHPDILEGEGLELRRLDSSNENIASIDVGKVRTNFIRVAGFRSIRYPFDIGRFLREVVFGVIRTLVPP